MKKTLSWFLAAALAFSPGCIYVHVKGDAGDGLFDDDDDDDDSNDFKELSGALEGCLTDPHYDLNLSVSPWHQEADWIVRYAAAGSDGHMAFVRAKEAVLHRIEREGGTLIAQKDEGPHVWSCSFRLDDGDEDGKASVRLAENEHKDDERPHQLEVCWKTTD
jgi:hypothetical protein